MHPEGSAAAILRLLRDGPRQAQDLAAALGIDTSAVRRHLEALRTEGLVEAADRVSGPGRPKKMYALTTQGRETFPRDYALLLDRLLAKLGEQQGRAALKALVRAVAADLGAAPAEAPEPARALLGLYDALGFEASLEKTKEGFRLTQRNCIFLRTATGDPELLCECLDEGIIRAALPRSKVTLESSLAKGDPLCRHAIALRRPPGEGRAA